MTEVIKTNNKTIAKNTMLLYMRMLLLMVISLYTSRVVLEALGETNFGIYEVVGGIVGALSFLNGVLSSTTSRFLSYEIGRGDKKRMSLNFSTIMIVHLILAVLIVFVSETFGMWFVYNKMTIPADRLDAAVVALQCSTFASVVAVTQIPYNSSIISHEKMGVYAYLSLFEAVLKLLIVYVLLITTYDRLKLYALLVLVANIIVASLYRIYSLKHFKETVFRFVFDKQIFKDILGYSFWNLLTNISMTLKNQGVIMLMSAFFSPPIVAARAIANKANHAILQFSNNFRLAANPQIIKRFSSGDLDGSKSLTISASKLNFFLLWILGLPLILLAKPVLDIWLEEVPEYSVIFLQLITATSIVDSMQNTFYIAMCAQGNLKLNSIWTSLVSIIVVPIGYLFFKLGYSPVVIAYIILIDDLAISFIVKPIVMVKVTDYTWKDMHKIFVPCLKVAFFSLIVPLTLYLYRDEIFTMHRLGDIVIGIISVTSAGLFIWFMGFDRNIRCKFINVVKSKIKHKK